MPLLKHVLTSALAIMSSLSPSKAVSNPLALSISNTQTVAIPSTLFGWMWEDINHSGDGGLYGELLQNRAFQAVTAGTSAALNAWQAIGAAGIAVTGTGGVSTALPNNLAVTIPSTSTGTVGFQNTGFFGIKVQAGWTYTGSFYAKSASFTGPLTVALKSTSGTTTFASATVSGVSSTWKKFTFKFTPTTSAPDINNVFTVTFSGAAGKALNFGLFSLFPPTFKGRVNGMRMDLAQALADTKPGVWRFPGGNNLEGQTWDTRWKWNETIGPLENRPGRQGDWGYANTDGVGLMEYLQWAEDIGATPILGVWDGLSLGSNPVVPQDQLQPYIDDVINEIEFITADASTNQWGALRASLGRTEPFALKYVEIGNEDMFQAASYQAYRWPMFVNQLGAKFPNLEFLSTALPNTALTPAYKKIDFHQYNTPSWFTSNAFMWDNYPRNGTQWFVGEYAVISTNASDIFGTPATGRLNFPTIQGSVAEAAFMTAMERNSDVVFASAYAPTLQHISSTQWTPDIITFDAGSLVKSTSYWVQHMFSTNRGTHVLQTSPASSSSTTPLFWVASRNEQTNTIFVKVVNTGTASQTVNFTFGFSIPSKSGTATTLSSPTAGNFVVSNTLTQPNLVVPITSQFTMSSTTAYSRTFDANTVTILSFSTVRR